MKTIIYYLLGLFILSACNNLNKADFDKKVNDTLIIYKQDTLIDCLPYANIGGICNGKISKILLDSTQGITLSNNDGNYKVISFEFSCFVLGKWLVLQNEGMVFNEEIKNAILKTPHHYAKFYFEKIKVVNAKNEEKILNPVIIHYPDYNRY